MPKAAALMYDALSDGVWPLTRSELAHDLAMARSLGESLTYWDTTDRAGRRVRVIRHEGLTHDGEPIDGVYVIPI